VSRWGGWKERSAGLRKSGMGGEGHRQKA